MLNNRKDFIAKKLEKSIDFQTYWKKFEETAEQKKGATEGYDQYYHINWVRSSRWLKQGLAESVAIESFSKKQIHETWLVITEYWCGDAAHNLPFVQMLADYNPTIEVRYLFRDENLDLMDDYLSPTGGRSIPIVIRMNTSTQTEIGSWGPRPEKAQALFLELKNAEMSQQERINSLQKWYNSNKGKDVVNEFLSLFNSL